MINQSSGNKRKRVSDAFLNAVFKKTFEDAHIFTEDEMVYVKATYDLLMAGKHDAARFVAHANPLSLELLFAAKTAIIN